MRYDIFYAHAAAHFRMRSSAGSVQSKAPYKIRLGLLLATRNFFRIEKRPILRYLGAVFLKSVRIHQYNTYLFLCQRLWDSSPCRLRFLSMYGWKYNQIQDIHCLYHCLIESRSWCLLDWWLDTYFIFCKDKWLNFGTRKMRVLAVRHHIKSYHVSSDATMIGPWKVARKFFDAYLRWHNIALA